MRSSLLTSLLASTAAAFEYHILMGSMLDSYVAQQKYLGREPELPCKEILKEAMKAQPTTPPVIVKAHEDDKIFGECPLTAAVELEADMRTYSADINKWASSAMAEMQQYKACGFTAVDAPEPTETCTMKFVAEADLPEPTNTEDPKKSAKETETKSAAKETITPKAKKEDAKDGKKKAKKEEKDEL
ncbi:hypothetical protein VHEMI04442 [[Torrubiella] hemipterigena]|uniref:Uncharacterized protein n=1 Tax=[Torrubiella] hemipterigena TaxID=1531966 RepID=A0A0A1TEA0_9HYPO|nr:hypothetical protein VHEMI04442 [[Torrubiella] hemipterigena]